MSGDKEIFAPNELSTNKKQKTRVIEGFIFNQVRCLNVTPCFFSDHFDSEE